MEIFRKVKGIQEPEENGIEEAEATAEACEVSAEEPTEEVSAVSESEPAATDMPAEVGLEPENQ